MTKTKYKLNSTQLPRDLKKHVGLVTVIDLFFIDSVWTPRTWPNRWTHNKTSNNTWSPRDLLWRVDFRLCPNYTVRQSTSTYDLTQTSTHKVKFGKFIKIIIISLHSNKRATRGHLWNRWALAYASLLLAPRVLRLFLIIVIILIIFVNHSL